MTSGRPKSTSRDTIAEAACELFLERGYEHTSAAAIARRAGVSRSSFFNYFDSKAAVLWGGFDERADAAVSALAAGTEPAAALRALVTGFAPDSLALAVTNSDVMGIAAQLEDERALRQARLARAIAERLIAGGASRLAAEVRAAGAAATVFAAVWAWARSGSARTSLLDAFDEASAALA
ncbi:TetR/AcrR family transcriptional regulator [Microbacterium sp.]|uniref:TetR/AcrR family transcriptional regulator n=1 Tax=Microbacterium sp. TaxID=51671 RepID=UPI0039E59A91